MEELSRRRFLRVSILGGAGLIVSACAPKAATQTVAVTSQVEKVPQATATSPQAAPTPTASPLDAKTYDDWMKAKGVVSNESFTLHIMSPEDREDASYTKWLDYSFSEFKKLYPNAEVDYELISWNDIDAKAAAAMLAGTPLDVGFNWDQPTSDWAVKGMAAPLNGLMPKWWLDSRMDALLKEPSNALYKGKLYQAPIMWIPLFLDFRRDLLEAGGTDPDTIKTTADLLAALDGIATKTDMKKPFGSFLKEDWCARDSMIVWFYANGLKDIADFTNRDAWVDSMAYIKKLFAYTTEAALGWTYGEAEHAYAAGQIAGMLHGNWLITSKVYDTTGTIFTPEKTVPMPVPYGPYSAEKSPFYVPSHNGWYLMSGSQHKQAAVDFICTASTTKGWLFGPPYDIPATDDWTVEEMVAARPESAEYIWWIEAQERVYQNRAYVYPGEVPRAELQAHFYELLIDLWYDRTTPEKAYDDFKAFGEPLIKEAQQGGQ
jgi:ABC-type glycerol-3-phosphate transport system substrate-binding protein